MKYSQLYKEELLNNIIPFWEKNSLDPDFGGYFSCLDQKGRVYETDKFTWMQGRQAWMFSFLYNNIEKKPQWLEISRQGIDFLRKKAVNEAGDFYFSLTREGTPLIEPYNIFSDCFAAMAFGQYTKATRDHEVKNLAINTYRGILRRRRNPKGKYEKATGARILKNFSLPMILSNLVLELQDVLSNEEVEETIAFSRDEIMTTFLDSSSGLIFENVNPDGGFNDSFEGRLINPGHGLEAMWFMIDIGVRTKDVDLIQKASEVILNIMEYGWDKQYGGIFYFMDIKGYPPQQLEWDQKLWWVHLEALIALSKAYLHTQNPALFKWFEKVHQYTWNHFPDKKFGEWFGYLNRQGEPHLTLKGGKWKGCFHVPRGLYQCWKNFQAIEEKNGGHKKFEI
ncbi:N-acylglucosamine 2-epimerase [Christiangramia fulva]|uniref:N-acylglucosamine 2-epimerase n=1 Tax=Christiangramia fulva TaxID=2126553 RepID=A0A2R3ZA08_9FLAO|nr:AGE family epimerase/isomerase [Christiangramia fulva]AVR47133.1 N-acylglucosamine 2-epimerase [Christiangramia fulva]